MRLILFTAVCFAIVNTVRSQATILNRPEILSEVESCLYHTYGWNFKEAKQIMNRLERQLPGHPAPSFLEALLIYWEHFPLLPEDPKVTEFEAAIRRTIDRSQGMINDNQRDMEGIFFDMHARAFAGMFWADNGRPAKVIPDLDNMYRQTMRGIAYKDEFDEFYFSSGLYHYYVDAYVEEHPVYRPIAVFFRKGDRKRGLEELEYATRNTTFIRTEAILFMSLLQLNYEKNLREASDYAAKLYNLYPGNIYYQAHYIIILLHQGNFTLAELLIEQLESRSEPFAGMLTLVFKGFLSEEKYGNQEEASGLYLAGVLASEPYGAIAGIYRAIAYAGLARISESANDQRSARKYRRQSQNASGYDFILDYGNSR